MEKELTLIAATAMEMRAVIEGLGLDTPAPEPGETVSVQVQAAPVRLATSGIGPLAAAYTAGRLAGESAFSPERCRGILSLGIAGTYARDAAPVGSVVMATREIWPEYGLFMEDGIDTAALGFPLLGKKEDPDPVWNALALSPVTALAAMGLNDPSAAPRAGENLLVAAGPSVTVAAVSGSRSRAGELAARHAALIENMESFPLALAAVQANVPFAELRAVSNIAGERRPEGWNIPASLAALSRVAGLLFSRR